MKFPKRCSDVDKSVVDNKTHKYYPDVVAKVMENDGTVNIYILEIKPYNQLVRPTGPKRILKNCKKIPKRSTKNF